MDDDIDTLLPGSTSNLFDKTDPSHHQRIYPEPLVEQESNAEEQHPVIHLPELQTTQHFIDALKGASLDTSGMRHDDLISLHNPGLVMDLKDPSPLL